MYSLIDVIQRFGLILVYFIFFYRIGKCTNTNAIFKEGIWGELEEKSLRVNACHGNWGLEMIFLL